MIHFSYLGSNIVQDDNIKQEIKGRIEAGMGAYFVLRKLLSSNSFQGKLQVYKTLPGHVQHMEVKPWVLQKIFDGQYDPIMQEWCIRTNNESYQLCRDSTLTQESRAQ